MRAISRSLAFGAHFGVIAFSMAIPLGLLVRTLRHDGGWSTAAWQTILRADHLERWGRLLATTATVSGTGLVVALTLGGTLAVLVFKLRLSGRALSRFLLSLGAALPLHVVGTGFCSVVGFATLRDSAWAVGVIHGLAHAPIVGWILGMHLRGVAGELEMTALLEGASTPRTLRTVTLPMIRSGLIVAGLVVLVWIATDFTIADILLVRTFADEVYKRFQSADPAVAALVSLPQLLALVALMWVCRRHLLRAVSPREPTHRAFEFSLDRARRPLTFLSFVLVGVIVVLPLARLGIDLRSPQNLLVHARDFSPAILRSLWLSGLAGVICATTAVGIAWWAVRHPRWQPLFVAYLVLVLAVPAPVLGIGLIEMFNQPGWLGEIYDSTAMLVIGYVLRFLPIATLLLIPAVRAVPRELEDAVRVEGGDDLSVWWRVAHPFCLPTTLVAALVVTILSLGELPCAALVAPPGGETISIRFWSLIHAGLPHQVAALCLIALASVLPFWVAIWWWIRRR